MSTGNDSTYNAFGQINTSNQAPASWQSGEARAHDYNWGSRSDIKVCSSCGGSGCSSCGHQGSYHY